MKEVAYGLAACGLIYLGLTVSWWIAIPLWFLLGAMAAKDGVV